LGLAVRVVTVRAEVTIWVSGVEVLGLRSVLPEKEAVMV